VGHLQSLLVVGQQLTVHPQSSPHIVVDDVEVELRHAIHILITQIVVVEVVSHYSIHLLNPQVVVVDVVHHHVIHNLSPHV